MEEIQTTSFIFEREMKNAIREEKTNGPETNEILDVVQDYENSNYNQRNLQLILDYVSNKVNTIESLHNQTESLRYN